MFSDTPLFFFVSCFRISDRAQGQKARTFFFFLGIVEGEVCVEVSGMKVATVGARRHGSDVVMMMEVWHAVMWIPRLLTVDDAANFSSERSDAAAATFDLS